MNVELPPDLEAVYANAAMIANTPAELVVDFVQLLPRSNGKVKARIIISPIHAKLFLRALAHNISMYEQQFGEIRIPTPNALIDQFFRFPRKDDNNKEE